MTPGDDLGPNACPISEPVAQQKVHFPPRKHSPRALRIPRARVERSKKVDEAHPTMGRENANAH